MKAYCQATGIDFQEKMVKWDEKLPEEMQAQIDGWMPWMKHVVQSKAFDKPKQANTQVKNPWSRHR